MEFDILVIVIWFLLRMLTNDGDLEKTEKGYRFGEGGRKFDVMLMGVLLPDLFNGDPWQKDRSMASFEPWLATHTQTARTNIAASIKWMVESFVAAGISNKLGIVGFCFGGGKVIEVLAEDSDDHFGVGVSFYGTGIQPSVAAKIKVPVLYITGDEDPLCSVKVLEDIGRDNVGGSKVVVFNGRGHAFVHRPASSEEDKDAEEAFTIMRNWLHNGLVVEKK